MLRIQTNESWARSQVDGIPTRWRKRLLVDWQEKMSFADSIPSGRGQVTKAIQRANIELSEVVGVLTKLRLPLDASDIEICQKAEELAVQTMDVGRLQNGRESIAAVFGLEKVRAGMDSFVIGCGLVPPTHRLNKKGEPVISDRGAVARMTCGDWWRRGLRKMHAKVMEGGAIKLGYVNKARDLYVSNESLARRQQQIKRNTKMMESTMMRNEDGQEFSLAELASKGVGNKAIRRGELMTRIAGFEKIAVECKHGGLFLTVTCPSRMHKWNSAGKGRVYANDKYDGTTPREAQQYLSKCWARIRAKLAREDCKLYGFRIAEPHHDGCPHWHVLVFHATEWKGDERRKALPRIVALFRRYLLADSAGERGARSHRVKAEVIDWKKGSAAGYIAKYVAKNIDGLHVENDLYGNPAMETSLRVEAWASTWGIRQFQQIGGAPVGVWRELRRIKELPEGAPVHLLRAHIAVNKTDEQGADFGEYCMAQGGVFVGRNSLIKMETEQTGELGRYGEVKAPRPIGVVTMGVRAVLASALWVVKSVRKVWEVVRGLAKSAPWTRVNNCTHQKEDGGGMSEFFGSVGSFEGQFSGCG
jgi:hypothetical protein